MPVCYSGFGRERKVSVASVAASDVARPLSCKTKATYFFKTRLLFQDQARFFLKTIKLLIQDFKKRSLIEKNQSSYAAFDQSCQNYAGKRKKPAYYRLSSKVSLHLKLRS